MKKRLLVSILALAAVFILTACDPLPNSSSGNTAEDDQNTQAANAEGYVSGEIIEAESYETLEDDRKIGGYGEGRIGDTCVTFWFDFTVTSAKVVSEYDGYTPSDGNVLLVANIKIKNTSGTTLDMYESDFQIQWGDGDEDYGYPITAFNDEMVPESYTIGRAESVTYAYVYEMPADNLGEYSISFQEYFNDDQIGNLFFIFFEANSIEVDTQ